MSKYQEKQKTKCKSCGIPSHNIVLRKINNRLAWVCSLCDKRMRESA